MVDSEKNFPLKREAGKKPREESKQGKNGNYNSKMCAYAAPQPSLKRPPEHKPDTSAAGVFPAGQHLKCWITRLLGGACMHVGWHGCYCGAGFPLVFACSEKRPCADSWLSVRESRRVSYFHAPTRPRPASRADLGVDRSRAVIDSVDTIRSAFTRGDAPLV